MRTAIILLILTNFFTTFAQRDLTPGKGKRKDVFGTTDYKNYLHTGLQITVGPTYMLTRRDAKNPIYKTTENGRPMTYVIDPAGKPGVFIEVGLAHFTKKSSKFEEKIGYRFVSYYDWGLGIKTLGGTEKTTIDYYSVNGEVSGSAEGTGDFTNGYLYGRFAAHKLFYLGDEKKYFIDNGFGLNFDFAVMNGNKTYDGTCFADQQAFKKPLSFQFQYGLGFGIRLNRRSQIIPGINVPLFGFYEWRKGGGTATKWYSSNYVPVFAQLKFIYLFEKKVKGCNTPGTEEDRRRNQEFMLGQ